MKITAPLIFDDEHTEELARFLGMPEYNEVPNREYDPDWEPDDEDPGAENPNPEFLEEPWNERDMEAYIHNHLNMQYVEWFKEIIAPGYDAGLANEVNDDKTRAIGKRDYHVYKMLGLPQPEEER